jgi:hypothetical protein
MKAWSREECAALERKIRLMPLAWQRYFEELVDALIGTLEKRYTAHDEAAITRHLGRICPAGTHQQHQDALSLLKMLRYDGPSAIPGTRRRSTRPQRRRRAPTRRR